MNWTEFELLFVAIRIEHWGKSWTWDYSMAYEEALESIVYEHARMNLTVDESVQRFVELNQYIERTADDAA